MHQSVAHIEDEGSGNTILILLIAGFMSAFGIWAALTEIDEVTRGDGRIIAAQKTQVIQSSEPGIVSELFVRLGQRVSKGDLLMRLDKTSTSANLGEVEAKFRSLTAQVARLEVEHRGEIDQEFACPPAVLESAPSVCAAEAQLLKLRADNLRSRVQVAEEKLEQKRRELSEAEANSTRIAESVDLAKQELDVLQPLAARKVIAGIELIRAQRTYSDIVGQANAAIETIGRTKAGLREAELQVAEQHLIFRQAALSELTEKGAELSVVSETIRGAAERLRRTDIRSPVQGIVNEIVVNTQGAFVSAGDRVLSIVPAGDTLLVEARVKPSDIAFINPGQQAVVKVTAFDFSIFGGLDGSVENIGADTIIDPVTKEPYYTVIIRTKTTSLKSPRGAQEMIPGMVCNVDILTGRKTILQYIMKPINKARQEAFRER